MSYQKIADLIFKLHEKTVLGKVKWETTTTEGVYQAVFAGYSIRISKYPEDIVLQIYNEDGELIEEVNDSEVNKVSPYTAWTLMLNLYETARRVAMGTEEALDSIMSILDDDGIPF
jgi:hypothetical protein